MTHRLPIAALLCMLVSCAPAPRERAGAEAAADPTLDPLPSWRAGAAREAIVGFVQSVTAEGRPSYVRPAGKCAAHIAAMHEQHLLVAYDFRSRRLARPSGTNRMYYAIRTYRGPPGL